MNCNWETIGEKVFSLYEAMEYTSESNEYIVEHFKTDLEIEKKEELAPKFPTDVSDLVKEKNHVSWILQFRKVLEGRRSILTKLFSFGNYLDGVDTLVEYCDYYVDRFTVGWFTFDIWKMIRFIYKFLAVNKTTGTELCDDVWNMLNEDMRNIYLSAASEINDVPDYQFAATGIVVMADSDLNAVVQALIKSSNSFFGVCRVLVQEPVKDKLLNIIDDQECTIEILANLFVFRNIPEALVDLNSYEKFTAVSIWSENIIAAKKFAANLDISTIWINAHGELSPGLCSLVHCLLFYDEPIAFPINTRKNDSGIKRTINLFYGGKWEIPIEGEYWTDQFEVSFAQATEKDIDKCAMTARKAFKQWRSTKLSQRKKVIKCFAERLRAYGQSEYADLVLQWANPQLLNCGNSLSIARDGDVEITSTSSPVGVICIKSSNQNTLFKKLTIATLTGNTIILVMDSRHTEVSFAPYCDMLASCGFPPGVINCLFSTNDLKLDKKIVDRVFGYSTEVVNEFHHMLHFVTKPKSVWLQCG